ncbi:MAG: efflux RND transporter periplasmic adaptor subunit [Planctomycetota bacterium]|nr:efflux RND transporter periplasmic adaptor subunit [Planctomycetota bacterium]
MPDEIEAPIDVRLGDAPADSLPLADSSEMPLTGRQKAWLAARVVLKRVRFILVLLAVGMFIGYWDTVNNYWDKWTQPRGVAAHELEPGHEFYCPMDPQVVRSTYEPNRDVPKCPICGMPLSIRIQGEATKLPAGVTSRVQLSPERIQLAGIKTVAAEFRPVFKQTKTVGYVTFDESRLSRIVSRVDGYVEKLYVDETFTVVHKGDPLAEIYSPELTSTARELVLAKQAGGATADLAAAAQDRLLLLGVSQQEIDGIVASGQPSTRLVIRSPQSGYVMEKKIVVGASVEAKMTLFEVADLSTVWVEAEVYEEDIQFLRAGQDVEATVKACPNRTFVGKLALIQPRVEASTRTNRIRLKLDNPQHELRPGMFATVRINTPLESIEPYKSVAAERSRVTRVGLSSADTAPRSEFLVVPERAVIDTGSKKVVYVEREPGMFEGVEVELGPRQDDQYPVIQGLHAGDKVAAAGGFLIDAETRLNPAAAATYFGASGGPQSSSRPDSPSAPAPHQRDQVPAAQGQPAKGQSKPKPRVAVAAPAPDDLKNVEQLPEADRPLALAQRICPVTGAPLGSMGVPVKIALRGQPVFLCCKGCSGKAKRSPDEMLKKLADAISTVKR